MGLPEAELSKVTYSASKEEVPANRYPYNQRKYGSKPPASLPSNKSTEREGWVHTVNTSTYTSSGIFGSVVHEQSKVCAVYYFD